MKKQIPHWNTTLKASSHETTRAVMVAVNALGAQLQKAA